jgi:hypothetical protein
MHKVLLGLLMISTQLQAQRFEVVESKIDFTSNAALEVINASSDQAKGIIDPATKQFAFIVSTTSFQGFNSELQREHFNEKYLESGKYYQSSFTGELVEDIDFSKDGVYKVTAKGTLLVHGKKQPRNISGTITIANGKVTINSDFKVLLADHDIAVPKVVYQKIATEIYVKLKFLMELEKG